MSTEENIAAVRRVYEAFSTGKLELLDEVMAADCIDHNPEPGQGPGLEGIKESFVRFRAAVPDLRFTIEDIMAAGDKVVARATIAGTDEGGLLPGSPPTGKAFSVALIDIVRFAGGKAVERWGLYDGVSFLQQLGAMPEMAQTSG